MEEKEREATEKLNDTKRIEREDKKGEGTTPTSKLNKKQELKEFLIKEKRIVDK